MHAFAFTGRTADFQSAFAENVIVENLADRDLMDSKTVLDEFKRQMHET